MDDRIFVLFTLLSSAYHLYGQDNVTSGDVLTTEGITITDDVTLGTDDVTLIPDDVTTESALISGNQSANASGEENTELPEFWEYKLSLMVQAYAGNVLFMLKPICYCKFIFCQQLMLQWCLSHVSK